MTTEQQIPSSSILLPEVVAAAAKKKNGMELPWALQPQMQSRLCANKADRVFP